MKIASPSIASHRIDSRLSAESIPDRVPVNLAVEGACRALRMTRLRGAPWASAGPMKPAPAGFFKKGSFALGSG